MSRDTSMAEDTTFSLTRDQMKRAKALLAAAILEDEVGAIEEAYWGWVWNEVSGRDRVAPTWTLSHEGDSLGDDEMPVTFLKVIAPAVPAGQCIAMFDEYGSHWRYYFDGETCVYQTGTIVYA